VKNCIENCKCECHTDVDVPGPHVATCLWADPNYEPPGMRAEMERLAAHFDEATRAAVHDLDKYMRDNDQGPS
jgi:hypothetical protein